MDDVTLRELRYFLTLAQELHFGRAADRLGVAQPPLSRAIRRLEERIGVRLFDRGPGGTRLTAAGSVLAAEARDVQDAVVAAVRRTRRASCGGAGAPVLLVSKAGASHALLSDLLRLTSAAEGAPSVELVLCEVGEQAQFLRDGRADVALAHRPFDDLDGFDSFDILTEGQVALLPAGHPLAERCKLHSAELQDVPGLPLVRWPRRDGSYPDGPGPRAAPQAPLAQLIALGRALLVVPASSRAWQWPEHVAVPVLDAPEVTTVLAWPSRLTSTPAIQVLIRAATALAKGHRC